MATTVAENNLRHTNCEADSSQLARPIDVNAQVARPAPVILTNLLADHPSTHDQQCSVGAFVEKPDQRTTYSADILSPRLAKGPVGGHGGLLP